MAFWPPPPGACGSTVLGVAFSPNGKLLASNSADGTVRLWNLATGRPVANRQTGTGPRTGVWAGAFSPSGKLLAGGCGDGTVRVWNPAAGRRVATPHATSSTVYSAPPPAGRIPR